MIIRHMKNKRITAHNNRQQNKNNSDYRILLEIDDADAFNYEDVDKAKYSHEDVQHLLQKEILDF